MLLLLLLHEPSNSRHQLVGVVVVSARNTRRLAYDHHEVISLHSLDRRRPEGLQISVMLRAPTPPRRPSKSRSWREACRDQSCAKMSNQFSQPSIFHAVQSRYAHTSLTGCGADLFNVTQTRCRRQVLISIDEQLISEKYIQLPATILTDKPFSLARSLNR